MCMVQAGGGQKLPPCATGIGDQSGSSLFHTRCIIHSSQDFLEMLPLPAYTHPHSAPLNLATMIPGWANPSDLGPKTYIANGQVRATAVGL